MGDTPRNSSSWDVETFENWLEQTAESRDASSEEILNELATSLWVLDELEGLLDQTELQEEFPDKGQADSTDTEPAETPNRNEETADSAALLSAIGSRLKALEARVDDLHDAHSTLEEDISTDVDNVEEVLRYLVDRTDSLSEDISALNDRFESFEAELRGLRTTRERVADLKAEASKHGIRTANCEQCDNEVDLSMLIFPECPTCGLAFETVTPKDWWFGNATVGSQGATNSRTQDVLSSAVRDESTEHSDGGTQNLASESDDGDDFDMSDFEWESR